MKFLVFAMIISIWISLPIVKAITLTVALIKCQHVWLKWLDGNDGFVRIFSFDFSKAFHSVSHNILCSKLKQVKINPCIIN